MKEVIDRCATHRTKDHEILSGLLCLKAEILRLKTTLNNILAKHSGKSLEEIQKDSDRDFFMGGQEAKDYGLIDEIVETAK